MTIAGVAMACLLVFVEMALHVVKVSIRTGTSIARNIGHELRFFFRFKGMVKPALKLGSEGGSGKSGGSIEMGSFYFKQ